MLAIKLPVYLLFLYNCAFTYDLKSCRDCTEVHQCPDLRDWSLQEGAEKLFTSLCEVKPFMICCSDFAKTKNDIDNHSNIGLLPKSCGKQFEDRIIRENFTGIYEFPWMALISYIDQDPDGIEEQLFKCGGTIISSRYILTAAHCVYNRRIAGIRVGEYNIRTSTDCQGEYPTYVCESHLQNLLVEEATIHEAYSGSPIIKNNIALLRVNNEIDFSFRNVKPICLPAWKELRDVSLLGKQATVAGWHITEMGNWFRIPLKAVVTINAETYCHRSSNGYSDLQDYYTSNMLCAGEVGKDICSCDTGGPLMLLEEYKHNYRMIQYGINSYTSDQCGSKSWVMFTDVTKYMKWILDNMKE